MVCARFIVTGTVQGVFFRASTREQALRLRLGGSASNRVDGSVEVIASGNAAGLAELEHWLRRGPPAARVESVRREALPDQDLRGFTTR
ncbi:MAG: acylphosphatase [Rhodanobacteraceae bacterium]